MSGITGWISFSSETPNQESSIDRMLKRLDGREELLNNKSMFANSAVAACHHTITPKIEQFEQDMVCIYGSPYYEDVDGDVEVSAASLREKYKSQGIEALKSLQGRFVVLVYLHAEKKSVLAVDRIATYPISYAWQNNTLVFGSSHSAVASHPKITSEVNHQAIFNYIYFHYIPGDQTIYQSQSQLRAGTYIEVVDSEINSGNYWQLTYKNENSSATVEDYKQTLVNLIKQAVGRELKSGEVGAFLSGGTDSSTVSGILTKVSDKPAKTFSIGFDSDGYDEMEYARITSKFYGTEHYEYYVTPQDISDGIPKLAAYYSQPFGNSSAVPSYYCAKLARENGVSKLLAGDGGDELFAGNTRYVKQSVFSFYENVPDFFKGLAEPMLLNNVAAKFPPTRKAKSYIEQAKIPMPERMESYNLLDRLGMSDVLHGEFLSQVDTKEPRKRLHEVYHSANATSMLNKMLALDYKFTLADNDLIKVGSMTDLARVDVAYPLLSDELVSFAATLPPGLKIKNLKLRYFFKEALKDFLPPEVITKKKHGFGLPVGPWTASHKPLNDLCRSSLESLSNRQIIQKEFIDQLMNKHLVEYPHYYGTMVWILTMLEQWFQNHFDSNT